jgi:hypothetical protein
VSQARGQVNPEQWREVGLKIVARGTDKEEKQRREKGRAYEKWPRHRGHPPLILPAMVTPEYYPEGQFSWRATILFISARLR